MDYLRGKLRGRTSSSWGSSDSRRGSGDSRTSHFWERSKNNSDKCSTWSRNNSLDLGTGSSLLRSPTPSKRWTPSSPTPTKRWTPSSQQWTPSSQRWTPSSPNTTPYKQPPATTIPWKSRSRQSPTPPRSPPPSCPPYTKAGSWRRGRATPTPPPQTAPSPTPSTCESCGEMDYKTLFEKERQEKELYETRLVELEQQQKVLENNLKKFLDLKKELSSFHQEAEASDRVVNEFIKAVVPDFTSSSLSSAKEGDRNNLPPQPNLVYRAQRAEADPDLSCSPSPPNPPLPQVNYSWDDSFTSSVSNPVNRYSYSTTSRLPSRLDELKLDLVFDVNSKQLPTKLQLEIRDKKGRIVFRKRQNLYYVKVQERLSTLDAEDDYIMTVTSICGPAMAVEEVPIHNKYHCPSSQREQTTDFSMTESVTLPGLETVNSCRSPSEASMTSGFDERSMDSIYDIPIKMTESRYDEVCREVTATPGIPDLEEVVEIQFAKAATDNISEPAIHKSNLTKVDVTEDPDVVEPLKTVNPFLLCKKPIIPEVSYRWQRGFRRGPGSFYKKVPILKVQFKYDDPSHLLPSELNISTRDGSSSSQRVLVSQNLATVELVVLDEEKMKHLIELNVESLDRSGTILDMSCPSLTLSTPVLEEGVWHNVQPELRLAVAN